MNKKYIIILILCLILTLGGCTRINSKQKNMYTNDKQIAEEGDSYSYLNRIGKEEKVNKINLQFSKFYGSDTLWNIESNDNQKLELNFNCAITVGKFKAVLVTPTKEVLVIFEGSDEGTKIIDINEGKYILKIVGQGGAGIVQIDIKENSNLKLKKVE